MGLLVACSFPNGTSPFDGFEAGGGTFVSGDALVPTRATPGVSPGASYMSIVTAAQANDLDFLVFADASVGMGLEQVCRSADGTMDVYCLEQESNWNAGPDFFDPGTIATSNPNGPVTLSGALVTTRPFGASATFPADTFWCLVPPAIIPNLVSREFAFTDRPSGPNRMRDAADQCKNENGLSLYSAVTSSTLNSEQDLEWAGVVLGDGVQGFGDADRLAVELFLSNIAAGRSQMLLAGSLSHNGSSTDVFGVSTRLGEWQTSLWVKQKSAKGVFDAIAAGHSVAHHQSIRYRAYVYDRDGRWLGTMGDRINTANTDPIVRIVVESQTAVPLHILWIQPGGALQSALDQTEALVAEPVCASSCRIDVAFEVDVEPPVALVGIVADTAFWNSGAKTGVETGQEVAIANAIWFD